MITNEYSGQRILFHLLILGSTWGEGSWEEELEGENASLSESSEEVGFGGAALVNGLVEAGTVAEPPLA